MKKYSRKYSAFNNRVSLVLLNADEPNNGRMLWGVELLVDSEELGSKLTDFWNYISYSLERFEFQSPNEKFIFVPFEKYGYLLELNNESINHYKLLKGDSWFKFNVFSNDFLAIFYHGSAYTVNLLSKEIKTIKIGKDVDIIEALFFNDNQLEITYYNTERVGNIIKRKELNKTLHNMV